MARWNEGGGEGRCPQLQEERECLYCTLGSPPLHHALAPQEFWFWIQRWNVAHGETLRLAGSGQGLLEPTASSPGHLSL